MEFDLNPRFSPGSKVIQTDRGWRLIIPPGRSGTYRLAQLDDYSTLSRKQFPHKCPLNLSLQARISETNLPGTWGFGFWNDPFGVFPGQGGTASRLPALPNTAWFFYGSSQNWLSLRAGIPANGFFAGVINSPRVPTLLLPSALLSLPFLAVRPVSRILRQFASQLIQQHAVAIVVDSTKWHNYSIEWLHDKVEFQIDKKTILQTRISPHPPLGLVLWIDNQFAAWTPEGRFGFGTQDNPDAWLELRSLKLNL